MKVEAGGGARDNAGAKHEIAKRFAVLFPTRCIGAAKHRP